MKKIKKHFWVIVLSSFVSVGIGSSAFAHGLASSGSISAELHVEPNDVPMAEAPGELLFELTDTHNQFNFNNCTCVLTVTRGAQLQKQPSHLSTIGANPTTAFTSIVFPRAGTYKIALKGSPTAKQFAPFMLTWDVQVNPTSWSTRLRHDIIPAVFIIATAGFIGYVGIDSRKHRRRG